MDNKTLHETEENKIELNTTDNLFYVYEKKKEEPIYEFKKLNKFNSFSLADEFLKKRLDKKAKGTFKKKEPINAIGQIGYNDRSFKSIKITSIDPSSSYSLECWISDGKNKSKTSYNYLLKDNEKNWERLEKIKELQNEISELEEGKERFTIEELKEYFQD